MTQIIAHGGNSAMFPENTLPAYKSAAKLEADVIEMDVIISADQEVFCVHPLDGVDGFDKEYSKIPSKSFVQKGIPTLREVIKVLKDKGSRIYFDLKQDNVALIDKAVKTALEAGIEESRLIIGSRSLERLRYIRSKYEELTVLGLLQDPEQYEEFFAMGGDIYRLWEKDLTQARIDAIHSLSGKVWVTPGHKATDTTPRTAGQASRETLQKFKQMGVDGVIVNDVGLAHKVLSQNSLLPASDQESF